MFMEGSLLEDELYGDEPHEHTALNWPPPMALPELPAMCGPAGALPVAIRPEESMGDMHLLARAARASRGPILVLGTAVTVALSGGYAAGHAFGWKMPPRLRASVSPALTTFINEQIPALLARPGAPQWCPAEEPAPEAEAGEDRRPSHEPGNPPADAAGAPSSGAHLFGFAANDNRPAISVLPPLRRPFQERERSAPALPLHGVVWSPRAHALVSLSALGSATATATFAAAQPAATTPPARMPQPFAH